MRSLPFPCSASTYPSFSFMQYTHCHSIAVLHSCSVVTRLRVQTKSHSNLIGGHTCIESFFETQAGRSSYTFSRNRRTAASFSAPIKWSTGLPALKAMTVGNDRISYLAPRSTCLSVSIVTRSSDDPLPVLMDVSSVKLIRIGESSLHGLHQSA